MVYVARGVSDEMRSVRGGGRWGESEEKGSEELYESE